MIDPRFTLDPMPWQQELNQLHNGDSLSAARFLTLMESEDDLAVEEAFGYLEAQSVCLDISDLPAPALTGSLALRLKQESELNVENLFSAGLEENDPLLVYLQELASIPAAGDPQLMAERYLSGEHHLAELLVNLCLSRVVALAMDYTGHGVLLLDLIQEGSVGLWQSILQYEGGDFTAHCHRFISFYMAKSVVLAARSAGLGQMLLQGMEDYLDADQRLLSELGRNPTVEEIAQALHKAPEEVSTLEKMVASARQMDRLKPPPVAEEPSEEEEQAVEDTAYFQLRQRIQELLSALSETDAKLLTLRFGLEGGKPLSPVQTGEILGLTPGEVLQRETAALERLRSI